MNLFDSPSDVSGDDDNRQEKAGDGGRSPQSQTVSYHSDVISIRTFSVRLLEIRDPVINSLTQTSVQPLCPLV